MEINFVILSKFIDFDLNSFLEMSKTMGTSQLKQELVCLVNWGFFEFCILQDNFTNNSFSKNEIEWDTFAFDVVDSNDINWRDFLYHIVGYLKLLRIIININSCANHVCNAIQSNFLSWASFLTDTHMGFVFTLSCLGRYQAVILSDCICDNKATILEFAL